MLTIDRVNVQMDVLSSSPTSASGPGANAGPSAMALLGDPIMKQRLKEIVLEVLRDELRELERSGML